MSSQNSASHFTFPRTQACFPRPLVVFCLSDRISLTASAYRGIRSNANLHVITSPYPLKMSPQNSASHGKFPRTQACFPRPIVLFCLGDRISLTASAYRGIRSNANSADRNVTHNRVHVVCYSSNRSHSFCTLQLRCHDFTTSPQYVSDQTLSS